MNKVILIGRIVKDIDLKFVPGSGKAVTTITLAVDKYNASTGQKEADFISVTIWGKQAESTANYMSKGSLMAISGRIQTRSYDAKDGTKRYVTEVVANEVNFLDKKNKHEDSDGYSNSNGQAQTNTLGSFGYEEDMTPVDDNLSDIPF